VTRWDTLRSFFQLDEKNTRENIRGTIDYGLSYNGYHDFTLSGYTNADWAGSVYDRESTSGSRVMSTFKISLA
jgi:hypothetical protein